ncbi:MAG: rsuA [Verrucomicrobiaceae bacterium]|nr:rsuA [Verrucomicrobiaceae bacterium]
MKLRRLDQVLSSLGYASRRGAASYVAEGHVKIAGEFAERHDIRVDIRQVMVDDEPLQAPDGLFALFHKPVGYTCTHSEEEGDTIYDLLPPRWPQRNPAVTSIGRLDKESSGLLLLTDQGTLVQRYTSPKLKLEKVYEAKVDHDLDESLVEIFASGTLMLKSDEKPCLPAQLEILEPRLARVIITEGRYHQVRRMFASQGWQVDALHRTRVGPHELSHLAVGEWRLIEVPK